MPGLPLPDNVESFLAGAHPCVMATVRADGTPVTVACWYEYRPGGELLLSSGRDAKRLEHLRGNPNVAVTVLADDWYNHVSLIGRVVDMSDDDGLALVDRLSERYLGMPFPFRDPCVTVTVAVDRWHHYGSPG